MVPKCAPSLSPHPQASPFAFIQTFLILHLDCCSSPLSFSNPVSPQSCLSSVHQQSFIPNTSSEVASLLKTSNSSTIGGYISHPLLWPSRPFVIWPQPSKLVLLVRMLLAASDRNYLSNTKCIISSYRKSPSTADLRLLVSKTQWNPGREGFHFPSRHHSQS